ncbi:MAG: thermonuclease family protein [Nitrososphaera sp.]|nr:thermonuclease family protein [Nitrososphaera sp.]
MRVYRFTRIAYFHLFPLPAIIVLLLAACNAKGPIKNDLATPTLPSATSPAIALPTTAPTTAPTGETATVTDVIDGDTIDVTIAGVSYRVRYIGMDTPERGDPYYSEATQANSDLVAGQVVTLVKDVSETDRYGRLLRYVYLQDGTFVNAELVRLGYAQVATFPPDVRYQDLFLQLQREARAAGRGLWDTAPVAADTPLPQSTNPQLEPTQPSSAGTCDCSGNKYNCGHFSTHAEAQACFNYCIPTVGDVHDLDRDGDGLACESLP